MKFWYIFLPLVRNVQKVLQKTSIAVDVKTLTNVKVQKLHAILTLKFATTLREATGA